MERKSFIPIIILFFYALSYSMTLPLTPILLLSDSSPLLPLNLPLSTKVFYLGLAYTTHPFFVFLGTSSLANLSDIFNRKKTFIVTSGGLLLIYLLVSASIVMHSLIGYLLFRALSGFFRSTKPIVMAAIVDTTPKDMRANAIRKADIGYIIGMALGPILGGVLASKSLCTFFSPAFGYLTGAFINLLSLLFTLIFFTDTLQTGKRRYFSWREAYRTFSRGFSNRKTRFLIPQVVLYEIAGYIYFLEMIVILRNNFNYSSAKMGLVLGCQGIVYLLTSLFVLRPIAKRFYSYHTTFVALPLLAIFLMMQSLFLSDIGLLALFLPINLLFQVCNTSMYTNASHAVGAKFQGWGMGLVSGSIALAWIFGGSCTTFFDMLGPKKTFNLATAAILFSFAFLNLFLKQLKQKAYK